MPRKYHIGLAYGIIGAVIYILGRFGSENRVYLTAIPIIFAALFMLGLVLEYTFNHTDKIFFRVAVTVVVLFLVGLIIGTVNTVWPAENTTQYLT